MAEVDILTRLGRPRATLRAEATFWKVASADNHSNLSRNLNEEIKKNVFFPVLDRFRALRESCIADQSCRHFFIPSKLTPFYNRPND